MKIMPKGALVILALTLTTFAVKAQTAKINTDLAKFYVGNWEGKGQFANGKDIEADVAFYLSTDSCHLINIYSDRLPNRYKATGDWIGSGSVGITARVINNFTGLNQFEGQCRNDDVSISNKVQYRGAGVIYQSFIYAKVDDDHFKVTYVYGRDSTQMKEGDHLIFSRIKSN
jgi:hypothetical protein